MGDRVILHMWTKEPQHSVRRAHRVCVCVCLNAKHFVEPSVCVCMCTRVCDGKGQTLTCW